MTRGFAHSGTSAIRLLTSSVVIFACLLSGPVRVEAQKGGKSGGDKSSGSSGKSSSGSSSKSGGSKAPVATKAGNAAQTRARVAVVRTGRSYYKRPPVWKPVSSGVVYGRSYYGGYYPWGWGGIGVGAYYGGYYDPWWYDGYDEDFGASYEGSLHLKVTPRDASVYVDGYYAGVVDDFDGTFQRLKLESGPHRVEIRMDGYEPLMFETRITADETVNYEGELKRLP
jgi:hypothetical protein